MSVPYSAPIGSDERHCPMAIGSIPSAPPGSPANNPGFPAPTIRRLFSALARKLLVCGGIAHGFSLVKIARATEPMLSRDSNWVLQLKISRTWRPWAVWSVGFCGVRLAIYSPRRTRGTAKPECFDMFRVADRPATHMGRSSMNLTRTDAASSPDLLRHSRLVTS